jgi:hypothetical protein
MYVLARAESLRRLICRNDHDYLAERAMYYQLMFNQHADKDGDGHDAARADLPKGKSPLQD